MNENPVYTIDFELQPAKNNLRVTVAELGIELETAPGEVRREDAERVALSAISRHEHRKYEAAQAAKAS
jgi:hypothetical protein